MIICIYSLFWNMECIVTNLCFPPACGCLHLVPKLIICNDEDGQSAGFAVQPLSDVSQKNACLHLRDAFFSFTSYLSDRRGAFGHLISCIPMVNLIVLHSATGILHLCNGNNSTESNPVQPRAPSDCWQTFPDMLWWEEIWKDGGLLLPHLDLL